MSRVLCTVPFTKIALFVSVGVTPPTATTPRPITRSGCERGLAYTGSAKTLTLTSELGGPLHHQSRSSWPWTVPENDPLQYAVSGLPTKSWFATPVVVWTTWGSVATGATLLK